jgi:TonB family protein
MEASTPAKSAVTDSVLSTPQEKPQEKLLSLNPTLTSQPEGEVKNEAIAVGDTSKPITAAIEPSDSQGVSGAAVERGDSDLPKPDEIAEKATKENVADANEAPAERKAKALDGRVAEPITGELSSASGPQAAQPQVIKGRVTDAGNGSPIPGANILVQGTSQGVVSDLNGNYQFITHVPGNLVVSFIGYRTTEVKVPAGQSQVNVQLPPDMTALNEVVVTGYGVSKKGEDDAPEEPIQLARPVGGKRAYNKYLDDNVHYPQIALDQKIEGTVTVEFSVLSNGSLSEFVVIRGLDASCNQEVIRLVEEGPAWSPSLQGNVPLKSTVRVRVKFNLPK